MNIAEYILGILQSQERTKTWLADKIDISKQAIHYKFKSNSFTAEELLRIARILGIDLNGLKEKYEEELRMSINEWIEKMMEEVEGEVFVSCVMEEIPYHNSTKRYHVYNTEGTFDKLFDITIDEEDNITGIE